MTTIYKDKEFNTTEELRDFINSELSQLEYPYEVKHKTFGEGQLTYVKAPPKGGSLYATIDFNTGSKILALDVVFANQLIEMPEILEDILLEAQNTFKVDYIERQEAEALAARVAKAKADETKKKEEEDRKAEAAYQKRKAKALEDFETLATSERHLNSTDEFYYSVGWLAKNIGAVTATLPDYLGAAFEKHFGAETPKTLIDSKVKSIGGYAKKWGWEFSCRIKKLKELTVPAYIHTIATDVNKGIHNTDFIWDLVDNYGFQFGKTQDLDKIRSCIPTNHISSFEAGLTA